jgi:hypothetical protein
MKIFKACISCLAMSAVVALFTIATPVGSSVQAAQMCSMWWQPVCGIGKDGKKHTWANDCWAANDSATHVKPGACK